MAVKYSTCVKRTAEAQPRGMQSAYGTVMLLVFVLSHAPLDDRTVTKQRRTQGLEPPRASDELPPVRIDLADDDSVLSDAPDVDAVLSRFFGRDVEFGLLHSNAIPKKPGGVRSTGLSASVLTAPR